MNKRSAQKNESSNPVRPIYTTSVEMPHVVEMQKEDEEEEDSRGCAAGLLQKTTRGSDGV